MLLFFFFFNDTATTEIYTTEDTLSLHDALPICRRRWPGRPGCPWHRSAPVPGKDRKSTRRTPVTLSYLVCRLLLEKKKNTITIKQPHSLSKQYNSTPYREKLV